MTARSKKKADTKNPQRGLSLSKQTLKDLDPGPKDPKGGFLMKDTIIVRPTR